MQCAAEGVKWQQTAQSGASKWAPHVVGRLILVSGCLGHSNVSHTWSHKAAEHVTLGHTRLGCRSHLVTRRCVQRPLAASLTMQFQQRVDADLEKNSADAEAAAASELPATAARMADCVSVSDVEVTLGPEAPLNCLRWRPDLGPPSAAVAGSALPVSLGLSTWLMPWTTNCNAGYQQVGSIEQLEVKNPSVSLRSTCTHICRSRTSPPVHTTVLAKLLCPLNKSTVILVCILVTNARNCFARRIMQLEAHTLLCHGVSGV